VHVDDYQPRAGWVDIEVNHVLPSGRSVSKSCPTNDQASVTWKA